MALMAACGVLVVAALALAVWWRHVEFAVTPGPPPEGAARDRAGHAVCSTLRHVVISILGGVVSGLLFLGPVARLAMRLLAATAGDSAQGRVTEAQEVVGAITVDGTIGLVLFIGLGFGLVSSIVYAVARPFLPAGPVGGAVLGVALLVVAGPTLDPIRADNPDFGIVGPGWLALLVFLTMAVTQGVLLAVVHARLSHVVPLVSRRRPKSALWLLSLVLLIPTVLGPLLLLVLLGLVAAFAAWRPTTPPALGDRVRLVGRVTAVAVVTVSLPGLVSSVGDILRASPN